MATDEITRLHTFQYQTLGAEDLAAEQAYHRDMRRRHHLGPHTWGIVAGLLLKEIPHLGDATARDPVILPGLAVDGFGREIVVPFAVPLDPLLFDTFITVAHHEVWIGFESEPASRPRFGWEVCDVDQQYARTRETFRVFIDPDPTKIRDPIKVDGKTVVAPDLPLDESVPYQELPADEDESVWLIRLGSVKWDGVQKKFVDAAGDRLNEKRRYTSIYVEQVMAAAGQLQIRDRATPNPLPAGLPGVSAEVQGSLQIDRLTTAKEDVQIHAGKLHFLNAAGADDGIPLWAARIPGPAPGSVDLRVHVGDGTIGAPAAANARLSIGNKLGPNEAVIVDVRGDNRVEIPTGKLTFGRQTRQMLDLWTDPVGNPMYGLGVQSNTLYFRTGNEFSWFQGGAHSNGQGDAGGGVLQVRLNNTGFFFGHERKQMLNLWGAEFGIGIQDNTLYFRTGTDFTWYRGGSHADGQADAGGGALLMRLEPTGLRLPGHAIVQQNLQVDGIQNLLKVTTRTIKVSNGLAPPGTWSVPHAGDFSRIYAKFAVLQGFSIFGDPAGPGGHDSSDKAIPQHVFVEINAAAMGDLNTTSGRTYCSESHEPFESDNQVMFTLVILGKGWM
jgi:hypothetical protein